MSEWEVEVSRRTYATIKVQAKDYSDAMRVASDTLWIPQKTLTEARPVRQNGEPWVYTHGYYFEERGGPWVIVFDRATGHHFTDEDTDLLLARVREQGCNIDTWWNGAGSNTFSVRTHDHRPLDLAKLVEPRP